MPIWHGPGGRITPRTTQPRRARQRRAGQVGRPCATTPTTRAPAPIIARQASEGCRSSLALTSATCDEPPRNRRHKLQSHNNREMRAPVPSPTDKTPRPRRKDPPCRHHDGLFGAAASSPHRGCFHTACWPDPSWQPSHLSRAAACRRVPRTRHPQARPRQAQRT